MRALISSRFLAQPKVCALVFALTVSCVWFAWQITPPRAERTAPRSTSIEKEATRSAGLHPTPDSGAPIHSWLTASHADLVAELRAKLAAGASAAEILAALHSIGTGRPELAIDLAQMLGRDDREKVAWVTGVARAWAGRDPQLAWAWLSAQGVRLERLADGSLLAVMLDEFAQKNSAMVLANVEQALRASDRPDGIAAQVLAQLSAEALIKHNGAEVARDLIDRWARESQAGDVGVGALTAVAAHLGRELPDEAAAWLRAMPPSESRNAALSVLAADWVLRDPAAAMAWTEGLNENEGRAQSRLRAFGDWVEEAPLDAGQWLTERLAKSDGDPEIDLLIANLVHQSALTKVEPQAALSWIDLIAEPAKRESMQEEVLLRWNMRDAAAATVYVTNLPSADRRGSLLQAFHRQQIAPDMAGLWFAADSMTPGK